LPPHYINPLFAGGVPSSAVMTANEKALTKPMRGAEATQYRDFGKS